MFKKIACFPIRLYQWGIRPYLPQACRFYPSCSEYALEAINAHGLLKGFWLVLFRVCRCHPFAVGGLDPVPRCIAPEKKREK